MNRIRPIRLRHDSQPNFIALYHNRGVVHPQLAFAFWRRIGRFSHWMDSFLSHFLILTFFYWVWVLIIKYWWEIYKLCSKKFNKNSKQSAWLAHSDSCARYSSLSSPFWRLRALYSAFTLFMPPSSLETNFMRRKLSVHSVHSALLTISAWSVVAAPRY